MRCRFACFLCAQLQLLTAEYVPMLSALILYIHVQAQISGVAVGLATSLAMVGATLGRVLFVLRFFVSSLGFLGATLTYTSFIVLLLCAASYSL